jgi:protein-L-isoaspartate O-methyltransferase
VAHDVRATFVLLPKAYCEEVRGGEPELALLTELMPRGGTAVDVGAKEGFYAYALADIADRVVAFEPNPDYGLRASPAGTSPEHRLHDCS